jgi:hypothetical protein
MERSLFSVQTRGMKLAMDTMTVDANQKTRGVALVSESSFEFAISSLNSHAARTQLSRGTGRKSKKTRTPRFSFDYFDYSVFTEDIVIRKARDSIPLSNIM